MNTRTEPTPDGKGSIGIITHEGKEFSALGEYITETHAVVYLGKDGILTTWDDRPLGTYRILATWRTPLTRHYMGLTDMYQVEATINGRVYTGRSAGVGMVWRGKIKANQKSLDTTAPSS